MGILSYQSPGTSKPPRIPGCVIALLSVEVVINAGLLLYAASDRSWGAFGIMIFFGPLTNFIAIAVSVALIPIVRRTSRQSIGLYTLLAFVVPTLAIFADWIIIPMMGLRGC